MGGIIEGVGQAGIGIWKANDDAASANKEWADTDRKLQYDMRVAQQKGSIDSGKTRMLGSQLIAKQKLAYSNSGVDASTGTPASVMADTRLMSELDAETQKNDTAREVWGLRLERTRAKENLKTKLSNIDREATGAVLSGASKAIGGAGGGMGGMGGGGG